MTTSNCMTCIYGGSWFGEISTEPGHCYMFVDEPIGACCQFSTSVKQSLSTERDKLIVLQRAIAAVIKGSGTITDYTGGLPGELEKIADMLEADAQESNPQRVADYEAGYHYGFDRGMAQQVAVPQVDAIGAALELEERAETVKSQTTERAMRHAANCLRLLAAAPQPPQGDKP